ncbi:prepilin peptidase [Fusibacter bizertensis]
MNLAMIQIIKTILFAVISTQVIVKISTYYLEGKQITKTENIILTLAMIILCGFVFLYSNHLAEDLFVIVFLAIVSLIDYHTKTIVDGMMYIGAILFAILSIAKGIELQALLLGGVVGLVSYGSIYVVAKVLYKREAFGFGDVMFMGVIGIYLGVKLTLLAALLTFYVAIIWILVNKIIGSVLKREMEVAFAPFMAISCIITMMLGDKIIQLYMNLFMV